MFDEFAFMLGVVATLVLAFLMVVAVCFGMEGIERKVADGRSLVVGDREYRCAEVVGGTNRNP